LHLFGFLQTNVQRQFELLFRCKNYFFAYMGWRLIEQVRRAYWSVLLHTRCRALRLKDFRLMDYFRGNDYVRKAISGCNERPGSQNLTHNSSKPDFLQQEH